MIIHSAKYFSGNTQLAKCPQSTLPEFAFIGRSNVGKSSLINLLTQNGKLALTSHNPGKTILINHFIINDKWFLVDLPGYGYANRAKSQTSMFSKMIREYILKRENLDNLFVLIDGNIPPQKIDLDFLLWLGQNSIPFSIIFTKADKSTKFVFQKNINTFLDAMKENWEELPKYFIASSTKRIGRDEILDHISEIIKMLNK